MTHPEPPRAAQATSIRVTLPLAEAEALIAASLYATTQRRAKRSRVDPLTSFHARARLIGKLLDLPGYQPPSRRNG